MVARIPNVAIPLLFFVEGWLAAAILLNFVPIEGARTWWVAVAFGLLVAAALTFSMKQKLVRAHETKETMVPTSPDRHPGLDIATLDVLTADYAALGFEPQIDYTVARNPPSAIDGFARLLYNPSTRVLAEVNQVIVRGVAATAMAPTLFSLFEDDWSFTTMTRKPSKNTAIIYALRRPKRLWQIIAGAPPAVAFERHMSVVQSLSTRRALRPVQGDPVDAYLASQERQKAERYETSRRRNLFAFLWDIDRYIWAPKFEWMG